MSVSEGAWLLLLRLAAATCPTCSSNIGRQPLSSCNTCAHPLFSPATEPNTGITLRAAKRLMLSSWVGGKWRTVDPRVRDTFLPVFWVEIASHAKHAQLALFAPLLWACRTQHVLATAALPATGGLAALGAACLCVVAALRRGSSSSGGGGYEAAEAGGAAQAAAEEGGLLAAEAAAAAEAGMAAQVAAGKVGFRADDSAAEEVPPLQEPLLASQQAEEQEPGGEAAAAAAPPAPPPSQEGGGCTLQ